MTHRTSVLSAMDKVLLLVDGAQQAFGPRDEVMAALQKAQAQPQPQGQAPSQGRTMASVPANTLSVSTLPKG
jgi:ATP-binding cassette subfamily C exporter for protease/lipase